VPTLAASWRHARAEAARNVACTGARPLAATNCLNFGNPEKPIVMWQFSEVISGIAEASKALSVPITGGNVSFYNETLGKPIYPTPVLGVLGLLEDVECSLGMGFRRAGDFIVLLDAGQASRNLDAQRREFSSSEYAHTVLGITSGEPPAIDLAAELRLIQCLTALASARILQSAHDLSDGGLATALAESCFTSATPSLGAQIALEGDEPAESALFGERGARAIVSLDPSGLAQLHPLAAHYGVTLLLLGETAQRVFRIQYNGDVRVAADSDPLRRAWGASLEHSIRN
jgi:phosphoribosylformylglycinamidine (FGAM) synthase-like enzyme